MTIVNLQRDMIYSEPSASLLTFATKSAKGKTILCNGATVYQNSGQATALGATLTAAAGQWAGLGLFISPPTVDNVPYRVKANVFSAGPEVYLFYGYAPASPTGTDDLITNVTAYALSGTLEFDDCILVPALPAGDPDLGKPLCFGVAHGEAASGWVDVALSVLNMATAPPQYSSSSS